MRFLKKRIMVIAAIITTLSLCTGCELSRSTLHNLYGMIRGNTYNISFYSNEGENFMEMSGKKIDMNSNTFSSVVTITIDGKEVESCGSTVLFAENGLNTSVNFKQPNKIDSTSNGKVSDNTIIAKTINKYKNYFGKARVIVIQSQLGDPICAYSGDKVYWEVCDNLPKTTKIMIDGKALYIHRANFQIIDKALLSSRVE